jgi:hypothetical protein
MFAKRFLLSTRGVFHLTHIPKGSGVFSSESGHCLNGLDSLWKEQVHGSYAYLNGYLVFAYRFVFMMIPVLSLG